jgi:hypothetical protein
MKKTTFTLILFILLGLTGCKKIDVPEGTPDCIEEFISKNKDNLRSVYSFNYMNETVFLAQVDSVFNPATDFVYNNQCSIICAFAGVSMQCGDFFQSSTNKTLIWQK